MWRSQDNAASQAAPSRTDSATSGSRRSSRPSSSSAATMSFLKKFIPGQWKGRTASGDGDGGSVSHFDDLPAHIREQVRR